MEQKLTTLFQIIAHIEIEIDQLRASLAKAASSDYQKVFNLMDSATRDAVSSFELARFFETRKIQAEQDEVRMIIQHYDIQRKGKWDLDTFQKALAPRNQNVQKSSILIENSKELEAQLVKFFEKELDLIRVTHQLRVQLYEGGASPVSGFFKLLKKDNKEEITLQELDSFLRKNGGEMSNAEKTALFQRADKTGKNSISYKEFESSILPDVTRKKVMEKKLDSSSMTKSFSENGPSTKAYEAAEHLEVSFRGPQSTLQPSNHSSQVNTDNLLGKGKADSGVKHYAPPQSEMTSSSYFSEPREYPNKYSGLGKTVYDDPIQDKKGHKSNVSVPDLKTDYSKSSQLTREYGIPPLNPAISKVSETSEGYSPSFVNPKSTSFTYTNQVEAKPDEALKSQGVIQMRKPSGSITESYKAQEVAPQKVTSAHIETPQKRDSQIIKAQAQASILQAFETAPRVTFSSYSTPLPKEKETTYPPLGSSLSSSDLLPSSVQRTPKLVKAKDLFVSLPTGFKESRYQNYNRSFGSPSMSQSSSSQSPYITGKSLSNMYSSSALQSPVKVSKTLSLGEPATSPPSDNLQKALDMLGSPKSPKYIRFSDLVNPRGSQSRK